MKIAVCVKQVPEANAPKRLDPARKRLDRSGEATLNPFDVHAVEEALRVKERTGDGEVVVVSMGPGRALDALRKALAMGVDRAVLVSDEAAAGSDLVATSAVLARVLERESADLGVEAGESASRTEVYALSEPPPRGDSVRIEDDGNAADRIVAFLAEKKLL